MQWSWQSRCDLHMLLNICLNPLPKCGLSYQLKLYRSMGGQAARHWCPKYHHDDPMIKHIFEMFTIIHDMSSTLNSLASRHDIVGGLKLDTILEVWTFNFCLVFIALFLVKDLRTLLSNMSCSSGPLLVSVVSSWELFASSSAWFSRLARRSRSCAFSTSILSNSDSNSRRRLWTLLLDLEEAAEEPPLRPLSLYLWKPPDITLSSILTFYYEQALTHSLSRIFIMLIISLSA